MSNTVTNLGPDHVYGRFDPTQSLLRACLSELSDADLAELEADIGAIALGAGVSASIRELMFAMDGVREAA